MSKTCAFFGNDYIWSKPEIIEQIKEQVLLLIKNNDVKTFLVGQKGAYENDAYNSVLQIKQQYNNIKILLVVASMLEVNREGRPFDDFIFPDEINFHNKRWCIVYRNNWIIENSDFIIAYNQYEGRAYDICKKAKNKGVTVIELTEIYKE